MHIDSFEDLLAAARQQTEPQRLLFVFAGVELSDDSTPEQQARFAAGEGGALVPRMAADKGLDEITGFQALEQESLQFCQDWVLVFVAALSGRHGAAAPEEVIERALEQMTESIGRGELSAFLAFNRSGEPVSFNPG
jgi:hypothetical protein